MKILYCSSYGDAIDPALRMKLDGNQVRVWIKDPKHQDVFDGLVEKVSSFQSSVSWADLIVVEDNGCPEVWKAAHNLKPIFGGSPFAAKLEKDRKFAHDIMKQIGLKRFESISVRTVEQAIAHQKSHKVPHVFKPEGSKVESHHTIIGEQPDGEDGILLLERFKDAKIPVDSIEIEEKIDGLEFGIQTYFTGEDWIKCIPEINFEHKHINEDEKGGLCGEAGTLLGYRSAFDMGIFEQTLGRIKPILQKENYRGELDLNMIVRKDEEGNPEFFPLEYTPRFGKPSVFIEDELRVTPWAKFCADIAMGHDPDLEVHYDWAVGVVLMAFGFPFSESFMKVSHELPITGINEENIQHLHLQQAKEKNGMFVTASAEGYSLVATGRGDSISEAKSRAYNNLSQVRIPMAVARRDISDKISEGLLESYGILKSRIAEEVA